MKRPYQQELVRVPAPEVGEAPASWLTRAAASQLVSPREFMDFFAWDSKDPDLAVARMNVELVATVCGVSCLELLKMRAAFGRLKSLGRGHRDFLFDVKGKPAYRCCVTCLSQQRVSHFRIEWRFKAWRWCPTHCCQLIECCGNCGREFLLPGDMLTAGDDGEGLFTLGRCHCCGALPSEQAAPFRPAGLLEFALRVQTLLQNGSDAVRAIVDPAAVGMRNPSAQALVRMQRQGLLPHGAFEWKWGLRSDHAGDLLHSSRAIENS